MTKYKVITCFAPTVWNIATFAPEWYADALREALLSGRDARRREIVFAVCCAESYLIEWVRDHVLNKQYNELEKFFPATQILETMPPGWAAGVVCTLIRDLHVSVGTAPPSWLTTPCAVITK